MGRENPVTGFVKTVDVPTSFKSEGWKHVGSRNEKRRKCDGL